jgi:hypothetical protein
VKGSAYRIAGDLLQLAGNNGGEQGMRPICMLRLGEIYALAGVLNYSFHA